jgi:hypothetical protein
MADAHLLDLHTITGTFTIRIDGEPYFLSHPDALTLSQINQLQKLRPRSLELATSEHLSDDDERELSAILDRMVRIVLDAPETVHQKLNDPHRMAIVEAFTMLRSSSGQKTGATTAAKRTGRKLSQVSNGSMAVHRKAG